MKATYLLQTAGLVDHRYFQMISSRLLIQGKKDDRSIFAWSLVLNCDTQ